MTVGLVRSVSAWLVRRGIGTAAAVGLLAGAFGPAFADTAREAARTIPAAATSTQLPSTRVHVARTADGQLIFSDQPAEGAQPLAVRTYAAASDEQALARARANRDYWRAQADAFAHRQRARERDRDRAAAMAARAPVQRAVPWADVPVRRYVRVGPATTVATVTTGAGTLGSYQGGPGAASRAGAAFIGSGFAGAR